MTNYYILITLVFFMLVEAVLTVSKRKNTYYNFFNNAIIISMVIVAFFTIIQPRGYIIAPVVRWAIIATTFIFSYLYHLYKIRSQKIRVENMNKELKSSLVTVLKSFKKEIDFEIEQDKYRFFVVYRIQKSISLSRIKEFKLAIDKFIQEKAVVTTSSKIGLVTVVVAFVIVAWILLTTKPGCPLTL